MPETPPSPDWEERNVPAESIERTAGEKRELDGLRTRADKGIPISLMGGVSGIPPPPMAGGV
jgi:hypothetical protein